MLTGQAKVCRAAQTTTLLGGGGKGADRKRNHVNSPKTFVPHCRADKIPVINLP